MASNIQFTDGNGNTYSGTLAAGATVTITNVDLNETITVNASAVTPTGQQPHVESVQFIGPSRAGLPISKK